MYGALVLRCGGRVGVGDWKWGTDVRRCTEMYGDTGRAQICIRTQEEGRSSPTHVWAFVDGIGAYVGIGHWIGGCCLRHGGCCGRGDGGGPTGSELGC
eukprot:1769078-Rhodomonas_salina.1